MNKVREVLFGFDEAALEALANKGLLRRARKDLELARPKVVREDDQEIILQVEGCEVRIPATGPTAARCSCPATGICRHILTGILLIQETGELDPPSANDRESSIDQEQKNLESINPDKSLPKIKNPTIAELLALDLEFLEKWAGKAGFRQAIELLTEEVRIEISEERRVIVSYPVRGIKVFLIRGTGLDGIIIDGPVNDARAEAVAAVLHCRKYFAPETPELRPEKSGTARILNQPVVEKAGLLLEEMVNVGLSHLSEAFTERLTTAALSAVSADLPRLSLALRSLAEEVDLILNRAAQADEARLLRLLAQTYALSRTMLHHKENLQSSWTGQIRTAYEELTSLELHCVSGYRWESKSEYHGITLVFWDEKNREWLTWSDARPKFHTTGFDPEKRYRESAPWNIGVTLETLAKSVFELTQPRKNYQNRLSSSETTRGRILGTVAPASLNWGDRLFTNWQKLAEDAGAALPIGLREYRPWRDLVVLKPSVWGRRGFDPVQQEFFWLLEDECQESLLMRVPYHPLNQGSIAILENLSVKQDGIWGVIGRMRMINGVVSIIPLSLFTGKPDRSLIHLTLDNYSDRPLTWFNKIFGAPGKKVDEMYLDDTTGNGETILDLLLPVEDLLLGYAERGNSRFKLREREQLQEIARRIDLQSLPLIAGALGKIARSRDTLGSTLLPAIYLVHLHHQAAAQIR